MDSSARKPTSITATIELPSSKDLPPPQSANYFTLAFSGPEVQLLIGWVDLLDAANLPNKSGKAVLRPTITNRVGLSLRGLAMLKHQVDQIWSSVLQAGLVEEADETDTPAAH